jgi:hypothetical protein
MFKILAEEDKNNYYKTLKREDGSDIILQVPQYKTDDAICRIESAIQFNICISEAKELDELYDFLSGELPGQINIQTKFYYKYLDSQKKPSIEYYNETGIAISEKDLWNNPGIIMYELHVKGFFVKEELISLHVLPTRCVFSKNYLFPIVLKFPEQRRKIPPHMVEMFNKLPKEDRMCSICTEEIRDNIDITPCYHFFHYSCLAKVKIRQCPMCRAKI